MQYKYRWLYAMGMSLVLMLTGYFYDLQEKINHLSVLRKNEKNHIQTLKIKKNTLQHKDTQPLSSLPTLATSASQVLKSERIKKSELVDIGNLVKLASGNGLSLQSIKSVSSGSIHLFTLRLIAEGYFEQIASFVRALEKQDNIKITFFSCQLLNQDRLQMQIEITFPIAATQKKSFTFRLDNSPITHNPFCASINLTTEWFDTSVNKLQLFPLRLIKMVGYLQQGSRMTALLLLPNNELVSIYHGSILGKEKGKIITIQADKIIVQLQNKKQIIALHH